MSNRRRIFIANARLAGELAKCDPAGAAGLAVSMAIIDNALLLGDGVACRGFDVESIEQWSRLTVDGQSRINPPVKVPGPKRLAMTSQRRRRAMKKAERKRRKEGR